MKSEYTLISDQILSFDGSVRSGAVQSLKTSIIDTSVIDAPRKKEDNSKDDVVQDTKNNVVLIVIYAAINTIMCIPCIYGYASVIFNNDAFQADINALSKLVIFSSFIHQLCFSYFSSLDFSVGQVQDAGLLFLSSMANTVVHRIQDEGGNVDEMIATTIVVLGIATASLGFLVFLMGKYKFADAISYLPVPVVGGYLAFIGYFCLQAGVALCISKSMIELSDWKYLFNWRAFMLALPGLASGALFVIISRKIQNEFALPAAMVVIPVLFYLFTFFSGAGMEGAREFGWLGPKGEPTPISSLLVLFKFDLVHWDCIAPCLTTWAGMVFVVSFSSCLDVSAISIDMGEPLDTNTELMTVGLSNLISGCMFGFTGSYIFSQTIFVYRTKCWNRAIGLLLAFAELTVVISTVNILEVTPLFFLGATLIFIGFDLLFEWIWEIRERLLLSEYLTLIATFIAIQLVGIDFGIILGIVTAIVDHVIATSRVNSLHRTIKRSRSMYTPRDRRLLQQHGYHPHNPKIITLEISGSVFFGSSLALFTKLADQIGLQTTAVDKVELLIQSPKPSRSSVRKKEDLNLSESVTNSHSLPPSNISIPKLTSETSNLLQGFPKLPPEYVILNFSHVLNVDVSATRGCFLQLAKMCAKQGVFLCATGTNAQTEWMLRSHEVAYSLQEEGVLKGPPSTFLDNNDLREDKILLFEDIYSALEFCEVKLLENFGSTDSIIQRRGTIDDSSSHDVKTVSQVFAKVRGIKDGATLQKMKLLDNKNFCKIQSFSAGDPLFKMNENSNSFYVILKGSVGMVIPSHQNEFGGSGKRIVSGAGVHDVSSKETVILDKVDGELKGYLNAGGIVGYVDFLLDHPRMFSIVAAEEGTTCAVITKESLEYLLKEDPSVERIVDKVLLHISVHELSNAPDP